MILIMKILQSLLVKRIEIPARDNNYLGHTKNSLRSGDFGFKDIDLARKDSLLSRFRFEHEFYFKDLSEIYSGGAVNFAKFISKYKPHHT
jgi:hypothetical protein